MQRIKCGVALILMGVVLGLFPFFNVCAYSNPVITITDIASGSIDEKNITSTLNNINNNLVTEKFFDSNFLNCSYASSSKTMTIEIDKSSYSTLRQEDKQLVMEIVLNGIQNSDISAVNRTKLYNFVSEADPSIASLVRQLSSDVTADFARAYAWFKPFTTPISWFLGLMSLTIFTLLALTIVIDISFLVIPLTHIFLYKSNNGEKPRLVSVEAWSAMKEAESKVGTGSSKTPLSLWFLMKAKSMVVLGVCFLYLVSGKIYVLVANLVDYFSGLLPE